MQNGKILRIVFLIIVFILYSAFMFSGLFEVRSAFLESYIFSVIAFIYVLSMWIMDRNNSCSLCGGKMIITPLKLGIFYLASAVLLSISAGALQEISMVAVTVLSLAFLSLVTGLTVMMFQRSGRETVREEEIPSEAEGSGKLLQQMRSEINRIAEGCRNMEDRRRLQRIAERFRIAGQIRTAEIDALDQEMLEAIGEYSATGELSSLIGILDSRLDERKRLEQSFRN